MPRLTRSPRARQDLIDIWLWIAADSPTAADRFLAVIDEKLHLLAAPHQAVRYSTSRIRPDSTSAAQ